MTATDPRSLPPTTRHPIAAVAGGTLICLAPGAVYAWSLFYRPIEADLGIGRAWLSGAFAIGSVAFALAMVTAPLLLRGRAAPALALLSGGFCGVGLAAPGVIHEVWCIVLGYGVLFGTGCGLAYSVALQANMLALPHRRGLAAGLTAGSGALGSVLSALIFRTLIDSLGPWQTLLWGGAGFFILATIAAGLLRGIVMPWPMKRAATGSAESAAERRIEIMLWFGFFFGACAGLMALGHAAGIAQAYGGAAATAAAATAMIAAGNGLGRLGAGALADYVPVRRILIAAPLTATLALGSLALLPDITLALVVLTTTGLAYGAMAATYPASVAIYFGVARTGQIYGRVFTAWGVAGLTAPGIGGLLFDRTGGYGAALGLAAAAGVLSAVAVARLPPSRSR